MHLVTPLASGIAAAANGTVSFLLRGTATPATYYTDFEATQQEPGSGVSLDSYGSLVAYVAALVDVLVYDSLGVLVREFVAGSEDAAVEVISPSFTGVDYTSGASGVQKPTNLEKVLDAWVTSAGAPNWQILFNGVATNLSAAFSATFFNVRTYGATGTGGSDDRAAIVAAQAAAVAVGGGIVFFPPGIYRITNSIPLAANVTWLGSGGMSTKLAIDSGVASGIFTLPGNAAGNVSTVTGLWLGAINGAAPGALINYSGASTGEFHFTDCVLGNDLLCNASVYAGAGGVAGLKCVFTRCFIKITVSFTQLLIGSGTARLIVRDCDLINAGPLGGVMVDCPDGGIFEGNRFDWSAAGVGPAIQYIRVAPTSVRPIVIGNSFAGNALSFPVAIYNSLATPLLTHVEYGNVFGDAVGSVNSYDYAGVNYTSNSTFGASGNGSRLTRQESQATGAATVNARPDNYASTSIERTAGAALTVNATGNGGRVGDKWTLHIINSSGGVLTVTLGTGIVGDGVAFTITNGGFGNAEFIFASQAGAGLGAGRWYQVAPAART